MVVERATTLKSMSAGAASSLEDFTPFNSANLRRHSQVTKRMSLLRVSSRVGMTGFEPAMFLRE